MVALCSASSMSMFSCWFAWVRGQASCRVVKQVKVLLFVPRLFKCASRGNTDGVGYIDIKVPRVTYGYILVIFLK
jgi:hypothetical protein